MKGPNLSLNLINLTASRLLLGRLQLNSVLNQHQYGFRRGHSTEQAITQLNNWVLESMDEGKVTGLLFIDISKAFDSLNHKVLLRKLEHLGLSERSLRWFRSYLTDRKQSVLINGELSEPHTITLGVPQGSILGPLLKGLLWQQY